MTSLSPVDVAIALVWSDGLLLIARRLAGAHLGDCWEFPGGKCRAGEAPADCAAREVREELDIVVEVVRARAVLEYCYPDRLVRLHPFDCRHLSGEPRALGCREWRWIALADLPACAFPPANAPLLADLVREGPPVLPGEPSRTC